MKLLFYIFLYLVFFSILVYPLMQAINKLNGMMYYWAFISYMIIATVFSVSMSKWLYKIVIEVPAD
jgi:hypothetical protein